MDFFSSLDEIDDDENNSYSLDKNQVLSNTHGVESICISYNNGGPSAPMLTSGTVTVNCNTLAYSCKYPKLKEFDVLGMPKKVRGYWSFAHDPRQYAKPYLYNEIQNAFPPDKINRQAIGKWIKKEEELYLSGEEDKEVDNLVVIKNILKKIESLKTSTGKENFINCLKKAQWHKREFIDKIVEMMSYIKIEDEEFSEIVSSLLEQKESIDKQLRDLDMIVASMQSKFDFIVEFSKKYENKKSILHKGKQYEI